MHIFGRMSFLCNIYGIVLQRRETEGKSYPTVCLELSFEKNDINIKIILLNYFPSYDPIKSPEVLNIRCPLKAAHCPCPTLLEPHVEQRAVVSIQENWMHLYFNLKLGNNIKNYSNTEEVSYEKKNQQQP